MKARMRHTLLVLVGVALLVTATYTQTKVGSASDEAAIQKNGEMRLAAWNHHDAKGEAVLYAPDADRVNANGSFSGRAEIEKSYADTFSGVDKTATMKLESTKVRFLTPDVALRETEIAITGRADGTTRRQHVTSVYVKRNGDWMVVANRAITKQEPQK